MNREFRRFELLVPLRFNDGEPIPEESIGITLAELQEQFGAVSFETQTIPRPMATWRSSLSRRSCARLCRCPRHPGKPRVLLVVQGAREIPVQADRHLDDDFPDRSAVKPVMRGNPLLSPDRRSCARPHRPARALSAFSDHRSNCAEGDTGPVSLSTRTFTAKTTSASPKASTPVMNAALRNSRRLNGPARLQA